MFVLCFIYSWLSHEVSTVCCIWNNAGAQDFTEYSLSLSHSCIRSAETCNVNTDLNYITIHWITTQQVV